MQRRKNNGIFLKPSNPYHGPVTGVYSTNNNTIIAKSVHNLFSRRRITVALFLVMTCLGIGVWINLRNTHNLVVPKSSTFQSMNQVINLDSHKVSNHVIPTHGTSNSNLRIRGSSKSQEQIQDSQPKDETTKKLNHDIIKKTNINTNSNFQSVKDMIQAVSNEFHERYGGKEYSRSMLAKGIKEALKSVNTSIITHLHSQSKRHTAERIILALHNEKRFVMSFGGYSVTVGRGNFYNQSYPFVMERILKPVFEELDLELTVRNSAIGGIPSFPYGWCLANFLGTDSDVVSWDYGMNEGNGADAFESYLRQSVASLPKRPMMIALDNKSSRIKMLEGYANNGILVDSIVVSRAEVLEKKFLEMKEEERPLGFRDWDTWGAPKGSPGQSNWHPKYKEHELIGWMIAMHFLDVIEEAIHMLEQDVLNINEENHVNLSILPKPISNIDMNGRFNTPNHILFGIPLDDQDPDSLWHMDPVSCRTSFLPNISGSLNDIIVSGLADNVGDDLQSRDDAQYRSGWVLDVGKVERDTKRKGLQFGGFGYIDMKVSRLVLKEIMRQFV